MKQAFAVLLITTLCACATPPSAPSENKANAKWVGRTVDELIVEKGEPTDVYMMKWGRRVFEYSSKPADTQSQSRRALALTRDQLALIRDQGIGGRPTGGLIIGDATVEAPTLLTTVREQEGRRSRIKRKKLASDKSKYCIARFNISASDIVEDWSVEGDGCK